MKSRVMDFPKDPSVFDLFLLAILILQVMELTSRQSTYPQIQDKLDKADAVDSGGGMLDNKFWTTGGIPTFTSLKEQDYPQLPQRISDDSLTEVQLSQAFTVLQKLIIEFQALSLNVEGNKDPLILESLANFDDNQQCKPWTSERPCSEIVEQNVPEFQNKIKENIKKAPDISERLDPCVRPQRNPNELTRVKIIQSVKDVLKYDLNEKICPTTWLDDHFQSNSERYFRHFKITNAIQKRTQYDKDLPVNQLEPT